MFMWLKLGILEPREKRQRRQVPCANSNCFNLAGGEETLTSGFSLSSGGSGSSSTQWIVTERIGRC